MKRRSFISLASLAGAAPLLHASPYPTQDRERAWEVRAAPLDGVTVAELQAMMTSGKTTSRKLVQQYIKRINEVDRVSGGVNSVLELNPDALSLASESDRERKAGAVRGPLHGIPVLIKDNIDTADRMMTTAGALAMVGNRAQRDAFIVERLRAAGAVILGKTNLSEWANYRSRRSSSGWSGRGRQTRNPYALDRNPCGSSAGSAAAAAASLCAVAIGTETDGSIVCPSSTCGIIGIKPTVGLWSRAGIIPISATQDTAGPMGRTVADATALLGALTGVDENDSRTAESNGHAHSDYTQFLNADGLLGKRIGVMRSRFGFHEDVDTIMEASIAVMKAQGAIIVDPVQVNDRGASGAETIVLSYEFKDGLNRYLAAHPGAPVRTLADVIAWNSAHADVSMPYFQQETLLRAESREGLNAKEYEEALATLLKASRADGIDATMAEHKLDAIMAPTGGPAWPTDVIGGDHFGGGSSGYAARAGYPNITVPAGYVHGLPVGMSLFAGAWAEPALIGMAYAFEQATKVRRAPGFLKTLPLG
ncbi:MAG: amidase [Gemmatimonadales bacterium]